MFWQDNNQTHNNSFIMLKKDQHKNKSAHEKNLKWAIWGEKTP